MLKIQIYKYFEYNSIIHKFYSNIILINKIYPLNIFIKLKYVLKIFIYFINLILINIIYYIILYLTFFIYACLNFLIKIKRLIIILLLLCIFIKYYWVIYYYFFLLYKHYILYIPLFDVKESQRFFNFEWIDLRNYFNLIFLHNTLVDVTVFNDIIYNDLLNNLNKSLSMYGFKIGDAYRLKFNSMLYFVNKDTKLLDNIFKKQNNTFSKRFYKYHRALNKLFNKTGERITGYEEDKHKGKRRPSLTKLVNKQMKKITKINESTLKANYREWKAYNKLFYKHFKFSNISINTYNYKKILKIPLKYIYLYNSDQSFQYRLYVKKYIVGSEKYDFLVKHARYFFNFWILKDKWNLLTSQFNFFFSRYNNYEKYANELSYKHKIPSLEWTSPRWRRRKPNPIFLNINHISDFKERQKWYNVGELLRRKMKKNRRYKGFYLNFKYPYYFNKNKNIIEILTYYKQYGQLPSLLNVIKKYMFLKNIDMYNIKKRHRTLMYHPNKRDILKNLLLKKLTNWIHPFKYNLLYTNCNNLHFWNFLGYLTIDKYYYHKYYKIYKEAPDINLYFIKRKRNDYWKLKQNLLRMYSVFFTHYYLERDIYKTYYRIPEILHKKLKWMLRGRSHWLFECYRLSWQHKFMQAHDKVEFELFNNTEYLGDLFKQNFFKYYIYCDYTINKYNELYFINIKNYKLSILNKINNLKRFFYFKNKNIRGNWIFKYLHSFSIEYHIKHLLWNSPYSFIFFINDVKPITFNQDISMQMSYSKECQHFFLDDIDLEIIPINNYSMLFNLFLNIIELKDGWYDVWLFKNNKNNIYNSLYIITFYNYYNIRGQFYSFYVLDVYRFVMNFLFEYYINFLYRLTRYRYILDSKNYTIIDFIKRYFNYDTRKHLYFRLRLNLLESMYVSKLGRLFYNPKDKFSHLAYKKQFVPLWIFFDYYIKLFVYFLLNKYYTKEFFIYYWFFKFKNYFVLNYSLLFIIMYYYNYKLYLFDNFNINININIIYNKFTIIYNSIFTWYLLIILQLNDYIFTFNFNIINYNKFTIIYNSIFTWYLSIILQLNIDYIFTFNFNIYIEFFKILFYKFLIFNKLQYNININIIVLKKIYLYKLFSYYWNILFNIKNNLIYFKSNYTYFISQNCRHGHRSKLKRIINSYVEFKQTLTYRDIQSFKLIRPNILFFKNIYLTNLYNYVYLMNISNVNFMDYTNSFFYIFKYTIADFNIITYLLLYILIFLFLFFFYRKFYNIFFFCNLCENSNYEYNFNKFLKKLQFSQSYKYFNIKKLKFTEYFLCRHFLKKITLLNNIQYKIIFLKYKKANEKYWNNNVLTEIPNNLKLLIWPTSFLNKYMSIILNLKLPLTLKQEQKRYNFYFIDYLNYNILSFCHLYWFFLIPYFFFEYVLSKYHLKGHFLLQHKVYYLLSKIILDNFTWFIWIVKYLGSDISKLYKTKSVKSYHGVDLVKKKKPLKKSFYLKWDRFENLRIRMSSLGSYYYWFFRINKKEYILSTLKYFFNASFKSNYFYFIYIYFICIFLYIKKYNNNNKNKFVFINYLKCLI